MEPCPRFRKASQDEQVISAECRLDVVHRSGAELRICYAFANLSAVDLYIQNVFSAPHDGGARYDPSLCFHLVEDDVLRLMCCAYTNPLVSMYVPIFPRARMVCAGGTGEFEMRLALPVAYYNPWVPWGLRMERDPVVCSRIVMDLGVVPVDCVEPTEVHEYNVGNERFFGLSFGSSVNSFRTVRSNEVAASVEVSAPRELPRSLWLGAPIRPIE